jgi:hypothetical protein
MPAQLRECSQPELAIARREPARQERSDRLDIAFLDLTAAQGWRGRSHCVDRGNA